MQVDSFGHHTLPSPPSSPSGKGKYPLPGSIISTPRTPLSSPSSGPVPISVKSSVILSSSGPVPISVKSSVILSSVIISTLLLLLI